MEDPTTLAINLTYLGTLGLAVLMFLGLGLIIVITLVVAGVGRLVSMILLAMVGIFPKKDTVAIVHLPPRPQRVPAPASAGVVDSDQSVDSPLDDLAYVPTGSTSEVQAVAAAAVAAPTTPAAPPVVTEPAPAPAALSAPAPKRDLLEDARRRLSGASAAVKDRAWKAKVDPRKLPKPAQVKDWAASTSKTVVETQTSHHPLIVAASKEPPVLAKDWADAVAKADERAAARAKAEQPPAIKVTVREVDEPTPPSGNGKSPSPRTPDASRKSPDGEPAKPTAEPTKPAQGNGAKKPVPSSAKNGKTASPIRKGSLSGASRNS
ncbi:hypothetical protein AB0N65_18520 [Paenarthrobacter sp. NPDC089322]|uniref:hypothetical protein n=1 Tax=Paenarthrobacter sp. NPDC089322 TaxID=3155065 RepID=UPI003416C2F1